MLASPVLADDGTPAPIAGPSSQGHADVTGFSTELSVNNDKPEVDLNLGRKLWTPNKADSGVGTGGSLSLNLSAAVPIGGKDNLTSPATLDKLSNGSSVTATISRFTFSGSDSDPGGYMPGPAWQFGAEATLGWDRFKYRDSGTLAAHSEEKTPWSVHAFVNLFPTDLRSRISFGVEYQHAYKAQGDTIVCKTTIVSPADDCVSAAPGPPKQKDGLPLSLGYRRTIPVGWDFADLAISPQFTYDALTDEVGIDVPLYLLPKEKKSPVLPGVSTGWSTKDHFTFGLFIKKSFSF